MASGTPKQRTSTTTSSMQNWVYLGPPSVLIYKNIQDEHHA